MNHNTTSNQIDFCAESPFKSDKGNQFMFKHKPIILLMSRNHQPPLCEITVVPEWGPLAPFKSFMSLNKTETLLPSITSVKTI